MILIVNKYLVPIGYSGFAFYPFVFIKNPSLAENDFLINHEKIHLRQQIELLIIGFYIFYLVEYFMRLLQYKNFNKAYRNISFEREAYVNDFNLSYLKSRNFFEFIKYL
jgi:hypothetical protein